MRKPATFKRFLLVTCYSVGVTQVVMLGLLALYYTGLKVFRVYGPYSGSPSYGGEPPLWFFVAIALLAVVAVVFTWVMYRRGELDEYEVRRRR